MAAQSREVVVDRCIHPRWCRISAKTKPHPFIDKSTNSPAGATAGPKLSASCAPNPAAGQVSSGKSQLAKKFGASVPVALPDC